MYAVVDQAHADIPHNLEDRPYLAIVMALASQKQQRSSPVDQYHCFPAGL